MKFLRLNGLIISFSFCFINLNTSFAQKTFSLDDCIKFALENNERVKIADLNINQAKSIKRSSTEIPKATLLYTQGQFNSIYKYDNNITLSQSIPNPWVFSSKIKLSNEEIKKSELNLNLTKCELIHQIELCYYTLKYANALHDLIHKQDSIYSVFAKDAAQKYADGKGSLLEKITTETQALESTNELTESEEDIENYRIELQTLMHSKEPVKIDATDFEKSLIEISIDTLFKDNHPILQYHQQLINVNKKTVQNEKAHIAPDITVAYFNQTIYGPANVFGDDYFLTTQNRLQGFQVGLSLPLWYFPLQSKVQSAKINTQIAESELNYNKIILQGQYKQALTLYLKYNHSIDNFKNNIIGSFNLIVNQALSSYDSKSISYIEYLQIVSHALQFQKNYLNVIHQNNMQALKIKYLLSK